MAIVWACRYSVEDYLTAGRRVELPRPDCPDCRAPMTFRSGYWRWVRVAGRCHRAWIPRARCRRCRASHGVLPDFCLLRRLDLAGVVGDVLTAVVEGSCGVRPAAARVHVPHTTARDWVRRFQAGAPAGPDRPVSALPGGPASAALAALRREWLSEVRDGGGPGRGLWRWAVLASAGALLAAPRARPG
jgi:transposase-like protein